MMLASLAWRGDLPDWLTGGLVFLVLGWMAWLTLRNREVYPPAVFLWLSLPKMLVAVLLVLALFDPVWSVIRTSDLDQRLLVLEDVSTSMEMKDVDDQRRSERLEKVREELRKDVGREIRVDRIPFAMDAGQTVVEGQETEATDLGRVLVDIARRGEVRDALAVILLTDGGDARPEPGRYPPAPLHVVGIGSDPETWTNLSFENVQVPETVEPGVPITLGADLRLRGPARFVRRMEEGVEVRLEERGPEGWTVREQTLVFAAEGLGRVEFEVPGSEEEGPREFRLTTPHGAEEWSVLDNQRHVTVDVRDRSFHVLLLSNAIDWDFRFIKRALQRDPAVRITTLYRMGPGRVRLEGDRMEGDEALEQGFPDSLELFKRYRCVVVSGSVDAAQWTQEGMERVVRYVEEGGSVVWLGGEKAFGRGGYADTPLARIFPWRLSAAEPQMVRAEVPVNVPVAAQDHPMTSDAWRSLAEGPTPMLTSLNRPGDLKTVALPLLEARPPGLGDRVAVVALMHVGRGSTVGVAANTLWVWARGEDHARKAYDLFWGQTIRYLSGRTEGGKILAVEWDRERYLTGEEAGLTVYTGGELSRGARLEAQLMVGEEEGLRLEPDRLSSAREGVRIPVLFRTRGEQTVRIRLIRGEEELDRYSREFTIGPGSGEGGDLAVDHAYLESLARAGGGVYAREDDVQEVSRAVSESVASRARIVEIRLVQYGLIFPALFLSLLMAEWMIRRKRNLI